MVITCSPDCTGAADACADIAGTGVNPSPGAPGTTSCGCKQGQPGWADSRICCDLWSPLSGGSSTISPHGDCDVRTCELGESCNKRIVETYITDGGDIHDVLEAKCL